MTVAHVALWTRDLPRAAQFWCEFFGAQCGPLYHSTRRPGFTSCFVTLADGACLELMSAPWLDERAPSATETPGWAHVALSLGSVQAVDVLAAELQKAHFFLFWPRWTGDGYYEAVGCDPDGNQVEITL